MPSDQDAIQGLWRIQSCVARGDPIGHSSTHFVFDGDRVKEFVPSQVDGGTWATFELGPRFRPKRFTMTSRFEGKGGKPVTRVDRWAYELKGNTLRLCWPDVFGKYPDKLSSREHGVFKMVRDKGPMPESKRASGKEPIADRVLGPIKWDDDFDRWEFETAIKPGLSVQFSLGIDATAAAATVVAAARNSRNWVKKHETAARRFAGQQLLDTHNDSWNDGPPITVRDFAGSITLETVSVDENGEYSLYYQDGNLFCGHCIIVETDREGIFQHATIAG